MCVDGETPDAQRDGILAAFRGRQFKYLLNVGVLTTGYDNPGIDAIVLLRPTRSPGLLLQIAGRGLRLDPRKSNCLFLDYGGNLAFFGPLDTIEDTITVKEKGRKGAAPTKVCPQCDTVLHASATVCSTCGKEFPRKVKHEEEAASDAVTSDTPIKHAVSSLQARLHKKPGKPETLRIDYLNELGMPIASEWFSLSPGANLYAVNKSQRALADWWMSPFRKVGDTLYLYTGTGDLQKLDMLGIVEHAGRLIPPRMITTIRDGKFVSVIAKEFA